MCCPGFTGDGRNADYLQNVPADKLKSMGQTELNKVWAQYDKVTKTEREEEAISQQTAACPDRTTPHCLTPSLCCLCVLFVRITMAS